MMKHLRKFISITLMIALLVNSNVPSFAQKDQDSLNQEKWREIIEYHVAKEFRESTLGEIEALCGKLSLCAEMAEMKGKTPTVNLLYRDLDALEKTTREVYGEKAIDSIVDDISAELKELDLIKAEAKAIWSKGKEQIKGKWLVMFLGKLIPSLYIADPSDSKFIKYYSEEIKAYLNSAEKEIKSEKWVNDVLDGKDKEKASELVGLGEVMLGYAIISQDIEDGGVLTQLALKGAATSLSSSIVPFYVSILLEGNRYEMLKKYLISLGAYEAKTTDTHHETAFGQVMDYFLVSPHIKSGWNYKSRYTPGAVSRNGYYKYKTENGKEVLGNIWEDLPKLIASYGKEGEELLNDVFYNGLSFAAVPSTYATSMLPEVNWNGGAIMPFIVGSIGTNAIKVRNNVQIPASLNSVKKYFGANVVGLAEISLLKHKFYDLPDYAYYKRVHKIIAGPYLGAVQAEEKDQKEIATGVAYNARHNYAYEYAKGQKRNNFSIYRTSAYGLNNGNIYNGTLYNPEQGKGAEREGLLFGETQKQWNGSRGVLGEVLGYTRVVDIVLSVYYVAQLAELAVNVVSITSNGVKLLRFAKAARGMGYQGSLLSIARHARKGTLSLIKPVAPRKPVLAQPVHGVEIPTLKSMGIDLSGKPQKVEGLLNEKPVKVDVNVASGKVMPKAAEEPVIPENWVLLKQGDTFNPKTGEAVLDGKRYKVDAKTGTKTRLTFDQRIDPATGEIVNDRLSQSTLNKVRNKNSRQKGKEKANKALDYEQWLKEYNADKTARELQEALRADMFENSSWFAQMHHILSGKLVPHQAKVSFLGKKILNFQNKYDALAYMLKHPMLPTMALSPANASAVSAAHIQLPIKAPVEIVSSMPSGTVTVSNTSAVRQPVKPISGNMGGTLGSLNLKGVYDVSPISAALGLVQNINIFNVPFVAVRKPSDAFGRYRADDGEIPAATEIKAQEAETAQAPQAEEKEAAKILFTDEYKNKNIRFAWADRENVVNHLPTGFIEDGAVYRGITLAQYGDLEDILKGLKNEKTQYKNGIYFTSDVRDAIGFATRYQYGHLPVLVKSDKDANHLAYDNVFIHDNVDPSNIKEVLVWAEINGELGWWRVQLDNSGKVVLQPTDNMQTVAGAKTETSANSGTESQSKAPKSKTLTMDLLAGFKILPTDIGLVRQQKLQARREVIDIAAIITVGIFASGIISPFLNFLDIGNWALASAPLLAAALPEVEKRSTETLKSILFDNGYTEDNIKGFTRQQIIDLVAFFESTQSMREGTIRETDESFNSENFVKAQYDKPFNENIKQIRILFVNDNPAAQNSLKGKNFPNVKIDYADSGNEAINILSKKSKNYDIIITDMVMPQGNGYELAKWVHENNLHIPVILSSTLSGTPEQLYQKYFDGYIVLDVQGETRVINYASNFLAQWKYYDPSKVSAPRQKPVDRRLNSIITVNTGKGDRNGVIMSLYGKKVVITAGNDLEQGTDGLEIKDFYGNSLGTGKVLYAVNKIVDEFPATYQNYAIITLNEDLPSNFRVFSPVVLNGQDFYYVTPGEISRVSRNQDDAATWYENTFTIDKNPSILNSKGGILLNSDGSRIVGFDVGHYEGQSSHIIKVLDLRYDLPDEVKAELSGNKSSKEIFSFGKDQELQIDHNFDFSNQTLKIGKNNNSRPSLSKYILPIVITGLGIASLLSSPASTILTLASLPFWGVLSSLNLTGDLSGLKPEIQKFVQSRRYFDREIFEGYDLTPEQETEMRRILGDKFYELWQRYYNNKDLVEYARKNPKDIEELAKYSNRYETTLPTQTLSRFIGTNPLYVNTMREMTETFERDLKSGKSIEEAVMNMGKTMFLYHKKINQIRKFFEESEESNNVNWEHVETPSNYNLVNSLTEESDPMDFKSSKLGRLSDRVIFGILGDTPTRIVTPFDENKYGEYWGDFKRVANRPNTFKGVNLTTHTIKKMFFDPLNGTMIHPLGVEKDGFNNINAAFKVIQENYTILKPIIERAQKGENLSKEDIETAHKIIAEISYIFTNAKPLFRGSASANLVIVYALYHMLGIDAPQVKTGRELDLSAFVLTADEYQKEWLNLFSEDFNINTTNNAAENVSAKILFTDDYKNNGVRVAFHNIHNAVNLPAGFEELGAGYRGIAIKEYDDLGAIVSDGLLLNKTITGERKIFFASKVDVALDKATQYSFGHVPVLIKMRSQVPPNSNVYVSFDKDIKAEDIDDILVWANAEGKVGWWRVLLDNNGEVVLQPTENMKTIAQETTLFDKIRDYGLPVLGVGLAISSFVMQNPFLSLASMSLMASAMPLSIKNKEVQYFVNVRKNFELGIFDGFELNEKEIKKMKEILGEDFFNLWYKYYRRDLNNTVIDNSEEAAELAKLSNRYENTLNSVLQYRFKGTNPLFFYNMQEMSNTFAKDLADGKNIGEAFTHIGHDMFEYHKKINQIQAFLNYKKSSSRINWFKVKYPDGYGFLSGKHNRDVGFGILRLPEPYYWGTEINSDNFSEYLLQAMYDYRHPYDNKYKGVNLTYLDKRYTNHKNVFLMYPRPYDNNAVSNIQSAFAAMQEDFEQIKPIIGKYQLGQKLTKEDIALLHKNIADMSYIFTNTVPFYRGSSSANLVMIYALYQMAGIEAPRIKMGHAFDIEAFITKPEQYAANWLDMFYGKFIQKKPISINLKEEIQEAVLVPSKAYTAYAVWQLKDAYTKTRAYLKYTTPQEIEGYYKFDDIMTTNGLTDAYSIGIEYPKVISVNPSDLPKNILSKIEKDKIDIAGKVRGFKQRATVALITSPINTSGFVLGGKVSLNIYGEISGDIQTTLAEALTALKGKPITNKEWAQIVLYFEALKKAGFIHGDIKHNLFFRRDDNGKLIISILDFEDNKDLFGDDLISLEEMKSIFETIGIKEQSYNENTYFKTNSQGSSKLKDILFPVISLGLLGLALSNPITEPLALASVPLLASTKPLITNQTNNKSISAQFLFTDEYKERGVRFSRHDIKTYVINSLPTGFVEEGAVYRGMALSSDTDLIGILNEGLSTIKTKYGEAVYFSKDIAEAIGYSIQTEYGYLPVLIKTYAKPYKDNRFIGSSEVKPEKISEVLVWAETQGKCGWWKVINNNGKIFLQPTDNMQETVISNTDADKVNNQNERSAKVLFTEKYKDKGVKFFYKDLESIIERLPSDFEENNAIYRGMTLNKFEDLKRLFVSGLQVNKSNYNYIHFSREIETAIDYSTEYDYGHLPIIIKMHNDYYTKLGPVVKFSANIPASDIDEVIVWAELDGKLGWWKAVLDNKGEVVLHATDNMATVEESSKEVAAPAEKQTDFTTGNIIGVLTKEDTQNMQRIFGKDLFALWQDYYNKLSLSQTDGKGTNQEVNKITANNYGQYLEEILKASSDRENTYNGVKLSTVKKNKKEGYALINQPAFDEKQKENFYQVLQQIWEGTLKPLTAQRRQGTNWNAYLRKRLDANIATIAYLFANIMPLEEKSFSAVAALVHALYETAGIKAAPIKDKRALALYAISKDYDDYTENFRNSFDGNFVNIDANANIQTNAMSAKMLFTQEYKNTPLFLDDPANMYNNLPPGFEEEGVFYRGRIFDENGYEKFTQMFTQGLKGENATHGHGMVFATDLVKMAIYPYSLRTQHGHIPVIVKIKANKDNIPVHAGSNEFTFQNISPEEISEILVWVQNKWYKAQVSNNGEVVLHATDNIKEVAAPAQSPKNNLKNYILPVVGIGLLGLALSNPITAPLALASVPLLVSTKPLITNKIDNNAISAQVLFTDEYKNKDIPMPTEDEESIIDWSSSNVDIARGMRLGNYDDLKNIFTEGLLGSKTSLGGGKVFFSSVINLAVMYAKPHDIKRYIPVIIISNKEVSNRDQGKDFWAFENFDAKDITDVFVWAELEGQTSWWRAKLDNNGEVVLKYTGMKTLSGYGTFNNSY